MDIRFIKDLAERWARKHPDLRPRIARAISLVSHVAYIGEDTWEVIGSRGDTYYVGVNHAHRTSTCTCPDSELGNHCKHRIAVALVWASNNPWIFH